ncbi:hypothetical protein ACO2Q2_16620 [Dyella sp. KRB-257]|uniref:hypothetical protein n=1 Tax=Dyella sp. KRB-257 TaxID=3400915 RepID=UPI003C10B594
MPNLLLTASRWKDEAGASPPSYWNGSTYEFFDQYNGGISPTISATANAGEIVSFSLDVKVPGSSSNTNTAALTVNALGVWTQDVGSVGTYSFSTGALAQGDAVQFALYSSYGPIYKIDAVLTPTPNPSFVSGDLVRQQTTHRIYRGIDTPIKCYVRNELGRVDFTNAVTVQAKVYRYGVTWPFATLDATADANGLVQFTVPASLLRTSGLGYDYGMYVQPYNMMRFDLFADGQLVYTALMEIV